MLRGSYIDTKGLLKDKQMEWKRRWRLQGVSLVPDATRPARSSYKQKGGWSSCIRCASSRLIDFRCMIHWLPDVASLHVRAKLETDEGYFDLDRGGQDFRMDPCTQCSASYCLSGNPWS